jgi:hypothetical protein
MVDGSDAFRLNGHGPVYNRNVQGALGDDTTVDGVLGSLMRAKITSTGTYANTFAAVRLDAR